MSVNTDAFFFYGFSMDSQEQIPWERDARDYDDFYWTNLYAEKNGIYYPTVPYKDNETTFQDYWQKVNNLAKSSAVQIDSHSMGDEPIYFIFIKGTLKIARRGVPKIIDIEDTHYQYRQNAETWQGQISEFCTLMGIENRDSSYMLASNWN